MIRSTDGAMTAWRNLRGPGINLWKPAGLSTRIRKCKRASLQCSVDLWDDHRWMDEWMNGEREVRVVVTTIVGYMDREGSEKRPRDCEVRRDVSFVRTPAQYGTVGSFLRKVFANN